jgi:hypothetical protein
MPISEHILNKIRLLFCLGSSPNENEAASAIALANKLIEKYGITEEELESIKDKPQGYNSNSFLFKTVSMVFWMQQLAVACAKQFSCYIMIETIETTVGHHEYNYYVYGDDTDVVSTKFSFSAFKKKINELVAVRCLGRGLVYKDSYCVGVLEAIKNNISLFGIEMAEIKQPARAVPDGSSNRAKPDKEMPSLNIEEGHIIKDMLAYTKGIEDGNRMFRPKL